MLNEYKELNKINRFDITCQHIDSIGKVLLSNITFLIFAVLVLWCSHRLTVFLTSYFKLLSFFTIITRNPKVVGSVEGWVY